MKSTAESLTDAANQDGQQAAVTDSLDVQHKLAEWTSDCLLTMRSPIRFTRADWP
ncbi:MULTISPECIES: hypothetical protein [Arthrobacter]|uniref:hypothetical protein n=1 Tax=Arthrobacter TaxID=1663 RepID=UPI001F16FC15|nr:MULTISPECIES: hypothetical protein [Arthrobacter]MDP9985358.1 hypothetical protein [Arthrobacter oryzae]UKA74947.1 hypothetical protein LFT46_17655 [Arthrobacter sp. FW306-07-I]